MPFEIHIDRDRCMGSGQCSQYAPATFGLDATSVAIVLDPDGDADEDVMEARDVCPTSAITLLERSAQPAE